MDPRLRRAVDASVGWYEDIFALHGIASRLEGGIWSAVGPPPPLHSDAVVVEPSVTVDRVLAVLEDRQHAGFKDSFASFSAADTGMELLFAASWIHATARPSAKASADEASAWTAVSSAAELAEWTGHHDTSEVLLPPLLERAHFRILVKRAGSEMVSGAVARLGSGVVDISNAWAAPGQQLDWTELAGVVAAAFPGRDLVGYETGDDLEAAIAAGFEPVGDLRIWVR
jgi:hypothetical protein